MRKHFLITFLLIAMFLRAEAQKENYFSLESGINFGKANKNISSSMTKSGFGDYRQSNSSIIDLLIGRGGISAQYPVERTGIINYRVRAGHYFNDQTAIEAGFGLFSYHGNVSGYDKSPSGTNANYLYLKSRINTLYAALIKNNEARSFGLGVGPLVAMYKLTIISRYPDEKKNYLLPGGMVTGFWNFLSKQSWYVGLRSEISLTVPAKIDEIKVMNTTDPSFVSTFKSTKTGSLNGSVTLNAGIRF